MHLCLENPIHQASSCLVVAGVMLPSYKARQALFQDTVDDGRHEGYYEIEHLFEKEQTEVIFNQRRASAPIDQESLTSRIPQAFEEGGLSYFT